MVSLWSSSKRDDPDRPQSQDQDREENNHRDDQGHVFNQEPTERTSLLPREDGHNLLSPDDPAVSINLISTWVCLRTSLTIVTPGFPIQPMDCTRPACLITFCTGYHIHLVDFPLGVNIRQPSAHSHPRVGVLRFLLCNSHRRISGTRFTVLCGSI